MDQKESFEDLLLNESFVKWVKSPDLELNLYWERWMKHHEHRRHDVMLAREAILRLRFKHSLPSEEITKKIFNEIVEASERKNRQYPYGTYHAEGNQTNYYIKVAAVFLFALLSAGSVFLFNKHNESSAQQVSQVKIITRKNPSSVRSKIMLPDGTKVWLNAASEIRYPEKFSTVRKVQLEGEAYFEVIRNENAPFIVETAQSSVRVLGTSFNINAYGDCKNQLISLLTGKVTISKVQEMESFVLSPGEQMIIDKSTGSFKTQKFDKKDIIGWTEGYLTFKDASKSEIINKLERWYDVKITLLNEPDDDWDVNGYFRDQSLELVLDRLAFSKDFEYTIEGRKVTIKFN